MLLELKFKRFKIRISDFGIRKAEGGRGCERALGEDRIWGGDEDEDVSTIRAGKRYCVNAESM